MTTTPVTFGSTRQSFDTSRADATQQDFKAAFNRVNRDADTAPKAQSLIDTNRNETERQLRSVSMGNDARDPAPVTLFSRSSSSAPGSSTWAPPLTTRRDASSDDATKTTMDRASRSDDKRRTNGDVGPVTMHSRSNVTPVTMFNTGTIGGNNGQSALFMDDQEKVSVDTLRTTLNNRFPDGNMKASDLTKTFNVDPEMAFKFVRHHGTAGDPENLSNAAFVRHVERWQDDDGNLDQARFKSAIVNGASHININRFEHEVGGGLEFRGFLEAYRRAGGNLPEEVLARIYNRFKDRDLKGNDEILERSELGAMGLGADFAGDVSVAQFREALNALAFAQQNSAPPNPVNGATSEQKELPPTQIKAPQPGNNGHSQTIARPNGVPYILQQGNIQNIFDPSFFAGGGTASSSNNNHNVWRSGNNTFKNIWP